MSDATPEVILAAAIASSGGAAEWERLSQRAQEDALADCTVIVRSAFAALASTSQESKFSDTALARAFRETRVGLKDALAFVRDVEQRAYQIMLDSSGTQDAAD
ncbi:hypothetical protein ACQHIH_21385 (plasmid) [Xanthomonas sontii]|uniref:hypothetical protein n=1 Tax=Xanthomonas sontii TaxID=2650745 RepID=UPI003F87C0AB